MCKDDICSFEKEFVMDIASFLRDWRKKYVVVFEKQIEKASIWSIHQFVKSVCYMNLWFVLSHKNKWFVWHTAAISQNIYSILCGISILYIVKKKLSFFHLFKHFHRILVTLFWSVLHPRSIVTLLIRETSTGSSFVFGTGFKPATALQQIFMPLETKNKYRNVKTILCAGLLTAAFAAESKRNAVQRNAHRRVYGVPAPSWQRRGRRRLRARGGGGGEDTHS
jgi:hypothetical protein